MNVILLLKLLLYLTNTIFLCFGGFLMYLGVHMASDDEFVNYGWLLQTKYAMPVFYYAMFGVTLLGVLISALSILGYFSLYTSGKLLYSFYIFCLSVLLIVEASGLISAAVTPDFLGLKADPEYMEDSWQRYYAVPGKEYYTAAIDFMQTNEECCGSVSGKEWATSWWKLRNYGPEELVVPLSCCIKDTVNGTWAYHLDPVPLNVTLCQNEDEAVYSSARHTQGCAMKLAVWLHANLRKAVYLSFGAVVYQLCLLLAAICGAMHIFSKAT